MALSGYVQDPCMNMVDQMSELKKDYSFGSNTKPKRNIKEESDLTFVQHCSIPKEYAFLGQLWKLRQYYIAQKIIYVAKYLDSVFKT